MHHAYTLYICICIHTHIVCFEGKKYVLRGEKRPKNFRRPRPGKPRTPANPTGRDDIIHLQTPYTFRHQTPGLAGGRRRRHGTLCVCEYHTWSHNESSHAHMCPYVSNMCPNLSHMCTWSHKIRLLPAHSSSLVCTILEIILNFPVHTTLLHLGRTAR